MSCIPMVVPLVGMLSIVSSLAQPVAISTPSASLQSAAGGTGDSASGMMSADNKWVVFCSAADDLVTNDFNRALDVFVWNVQSKTTSLVSVEKSGNQSGNGNSSSPVISDDGRYVMFMSQANNLVENDGNKGPDIFIRDLFEGKTILVTVNVSGTGSSTGFPYNPLLSANARRVVFESSDGNLVNGDLNGVRDLFMRDLAAGRTIWITAPIPGISQSLLGGVSERVISADGERVAYTSTLSNLVRNDSNSATDVFLWDGSTNVLVSVSTSGGVGNGASDSPLISADGRYVAFRSKALNLVAGVTGTNWFVRDMKLQKTVVLDPKRPFLNPDDRQRVSAGNIALSAGLSQPRTTSLNGRFDLITQRTNNQLQVYLQDKQTATKVLVSATSAGIPLNEDCFEPQFLGPDDQKVLFSSSGLPYPQLRIKEPGTGEFMTVTFNYKGVGVATEQGIFEGYEASASTDGRWIVYQAQSQDLAPNTTAAVRGIYRYDTVNRANTVVSFDSTNTGLPSGDSFSPLLTPDGRFAIFTSRGTNLVDGLADTNGVPDLFMRDLENQRTIPITVHYSGTSTPAGPSSTVFNPAISSDGRYVAFESTSPQIVQTPANAISDVFVRDTVAGTNILVSVSASGGSANGPSYSPLISADGRYVAFRARASNLVLGGVTNETVYLRDLQNRTTSVIPSPIPTFGLDGRSITILDGIVLGTGFLEPSSFSRNGQFEAYLSNSEGARTNSRSGTFQVYLKDYQTGTTNLVSRNESGGAGWCDGSLPAVSANGRFVVFESMDGSLVPNDNNQAMDVFLFDGSDNHVELVSSRDPSRPVTSANGFNSFFTAGLSEDGQKVAFISWASNLVGNDGNSNQDLFVYDFATGSNRAVSVNFAGTGTAAGFSADPALSGDGLHLAFASTASDVMQGDTNLVRDVFIRNLVTGEMKLVSQAQDGGFANRPSYSPSVSRDGRLVAFASEGTNLLSVTDSNRKSDVFVRDMESGVTILASANANGSAANNASYSPVISPDGKWVAFLSMATDLVPESLTPPSLYLRSVESQQIVRLGQAKIPPSFSGNSSTIVFESSTDRSELGDTNNRTDLFVYDSAVQRYELISVNLSGQSSGNGHSRLGAITPDGRYVVFSSVASDLALNDGNNTNDVFLRDRVSGVTTLISKNKDKTGSGNGPSDSSVISADGRFVTFRSSASDLTDDSLRASGQIYVYDVLTGKTRLISRSISQLGSANARCGAPLMTADGSRIIFKSFASDLTVTKGNTSQDLFYFHTAPADFGDSDGDGLDDNWEVQHFGDLSHDGTADTDGDGQSDLSEFLMGTDPKDANSVFEGKALTRTADGRVLVQWASVPGRTYVVQYKDDLNQLLWESLASAVTASAEQSELLDDSAAGASQRYYRVVLMR